jgi:hypothetical protein
MKLQAALPGPSCVEVSAALKLISMRGPSGAGRSTRRDSTRP